MPAEREPRNAAGATGDGQPAADTDEPVELADKVDELERKCERMAVRQRALIRVLARFTSSTSAELERLVAD